MKTSIHDLEGANIQNIHFERIVQMQTVVKLGRELSLKLWLFQIQTLESNNSLSAL